MSSVSSVVIFGTDRPWSDGLVKRRYEVTLTDNNLTEHVFIIGPFKVLPTDDGQAQANIELQGRKDEEIIGGQDKTPLWNDTQADYDRRALGLAMLLKDTDDYRATIELFQAMELRSGNNAGQRAATLGVSTVNYNLMADRYGDMIGAAFAIDNALSQVWLDIPPEFE